MAITLSMRSNVKGNANSGLLSRLKALINVRVSLSFTLLLSYALVSFRHFVEHLHSNYFFHFDWCFTCRDSTTRWLKTDWKLRSTQKSLLVPRLTKVHIVIPLIELDMACILVLALFFIFYFVISQIHSSWCFSNGWFQWWIRLCWYVEMEKGKFEDIGNNQFDDFATHLECVEHS